MRMSQIMHHGPDLRAAVCDQLVQHLGPGTLVEVLRPGFPDSWCGYGWMPWPVRLALGRDMNRGLRQEIGRFAPRKRASSWKTPGQRPLIGVAT